MSGVIIILLQESVESGQVNISMSQVNWSHSQKKWGCGQGCTCRMPKGTVNFSRQSVLAIDNAPYDDDDKGFIMCPFQVGPAHQR